MKVGRPRKKFQIHRNPSGYLEAVYWHKGKRYRTKLHRYIMEKKLGRKLLRRTHVHHADHRRHDNRFRNLSVVDTSDHTALENRYRTSRGQYQGAVKQMLMRRLMHGPIAKARRDNLRRTKDDARAKTIRASIHRGTGTAKSSVD